MFRKMRRFKQQLEQKECIEVLKSQPRGVLSILGEDGYPYGIPIDYWYCEEENRIYFHGAKEGHKIDAINEKLMMIDGNEIAFKHIKEIQGDFFLSIIKSENIT